MNDIANDVLSSSKHIAPFRKYISKKNIIKLFKKTPIYNMTTIRIMVKLGYKLDWRRISECQLSEDFIKEHKDLVDWWYISDFQKLSEDFIKEHKNLVDWRCISYCQKLSEDFIKEHKNLVDWTFISGRQKLSEDFIKEHKDDVNWSCISNSQTLSEDFIKEHKNHPKETTNLCYAALVSLIL